MWVQPARVQAQAGTWKLEAEISLDKRLSFSFWDVLNDKLVNPSRVFTCTVRTVSKEERSGLFNRAQLVVLTV